MKIVRVKKPYSRSKWHSRKYPRLPLQRIFKQENTLERNKIKKWPFKAWFTKAFIKFRQCN